MKKRIIFGIVLLAAGLAIAAPSVVKLIKEAGAGKGFEEIRAMVKTETPAVSAAENEEDGPDPETKEASEAKDSSRTAAGGTAAKAKPAPAPKKKPVQVPIDFAALTEINPDVYAWITVPGTDVDYPILQRADDDSFYMHRDIYGNYEFAGCIYTEATYNTKTFTDTNTVIYGHRMKNGTMLHSLDRYEDRAFFDEHREILIYMPGKILHYRIFAAYVYDTRHLMQSFIFDNPEVFRKYLEDIFAMRAIGSNIDTKAVVKPTDRIITLSTCYGADSADRWLVQAVLTKVEE